MGKKWACHQLSKSAEGEVLLFIDADTVHHPATFRQSDKALLSERVEMLTALPHQQILSWGERFIVPIFFFF